MKHTLGTLRLSAADVESAKAVVLSDWLSPGNHVTEFENLFAKSQNQTFGTMTNSGTDALRIALAALKERNGWKDGDTVFVPAITFVATVNIVLQLNLTPKLVDVNMYDFTLNPENLTRLYYGDNPQTRGRCIIPVHLAGNPADMEKIMALAKDKKLAVLEDACETLSVDGICQGDISAFSFYAAHLLTTGVGGMATTNNEELQKLMWSYCNHGRREPKQFVFDRIGYSCRPTEFEAALGLNQLPTIQNMIAKRRNVARLLYANLSRHEELYVNFFRESANMFFPILVRERSKVTKAQLMDFLVKKGVDCRDLMPIIGQPCYKGLWHTENGYTIAKAVNERGFYIGCHQDMTEADVQEIASYFDERLS